MQETVEEIEKRLRVEFARSGGRTRAKNMTKKQRSESSRKAARARWSKKAKAKAAA